MTKNNSFSQVTQSAQKAARTKLTQLLTMTLTPALLALPHLAFGQDRIVPCLSPNTVSLPRYLPSIERYFGATQLPAKFFAPPFTHASNPNPLDFTGLRAIAQVDRYFRTVRSSAEEIVVKLPLQRLATLGPENAPSPIKYQAHQGSIELNSTFGPTLAQYDARIEKIEFKNNTVPDPNSTAPMPTGLTGSFGLFTSSATAVPQNNPWLAKVATFAWTSLNGVQSPVLKSKEAFTKYVESPNYPGEIMCVTLKLKAKQTNGPNSQPQVLTLSTRPDAVEGQINPQTGPTNYELLYRNPAPAASSPDPLTMPTQKEALHLVIQ